MTETNVTNGLPASKVCSKCKVEKAVDQFTVKYDRAKPRLIGACKSCVAATSAAYRKDNEQNRQRDRGRMNSPERKEYIRAYHVKNRDTLAAKAKARYVKPVQLSCPVYFVTCEETGKLFTSKTKTRRLSDEGVKLYARRKYRTLYAERYKAKPATRQCKECNKTFESRYGAHYCSTDCSKAWQRRNTKMDNTHQRRAKKFGVAYQPIDPFKIFDRDKWKCKQCGVSTPKALRGNLVDNAPELDHIIPMSKGGPHLPVNLQCLCHRCNAMKSDKVYGQMSLAI